MKHYNAISPFDNLLLAYIIRQEHDSLVPVNAEKEAELVFASQFAQTLPDEKVRKMLGDLRVALTKDSLGSLVHNGIQQSGISAAMLQASTGLTSSMIEDIKSDMVFTNSIPVRSLVKLLKQLGIPLQKALGAIQTTFEKLSTENKMFLALPVRSQPAFRKGMTHGEASFDLKRLRSDESYLYQNKEALDKYTARFEELYAEM